MISLEDLTLAMDRIYLQEQSGGVCLRGISGGEFLRQQQYQKLIGQKECFAGRKKRGQSMKIGKKYF